MQHYQTLQQANSYITAPDGTRRYSRYEVGVIDGRYRAMPVLIADKAGFDGLGFDASVGSGDDHYTVLNLFDGSHKYIDSVAVVGADDDDHAAHLALSQFDYLGADYATVVVNDSAQYDDMSLDALGQDGWSSQAIAQLMNHPSQNTGYYLPIINSKMLRTEQNRVTADNVMWDGANLVSHGSDYSRLLLDLQKHDAFGGLTAKFDMRELLAYLGATELGFDALMETYSRLDAMGDRLFTALGRHAVGDLTVTNVTTTKPFKRQGVANVAMQFDLSDGQTFSIIFHNPDADPKKLAAGDTMVSWKWLLNKKDVTAAVSPKQSDKVRYDVIASRIMKVAAKNSKRFVAAQMKKAQNQEKITEAQKAVDDKQAYLEQLDKDIAELKQQIDDFRLSDEAVAVSTNKAKASSRQKITVQPLSAIEGSATDDLIDKAMKVAAKDIDKIVQDIRMADKKKQNAESLAEKTDIMEQKNRLNQKLKNARLKLFDIEDAITAFYRNGTSLDDVDLLELFPKVAALIGVGQSINEAAAVGEASQAGHSTEMVKLDLTAANPLDEQQVINEYATDNNAFDGDYIDTFKDDRDIFNAIDKAQNALAEKGYPAWAIATANGDYVAVYILPDGKFSSSDMRESAESAYQNMLTSRENQIKSPDGHNAKVLADRNAQAAQPHPAYSQDDIAFLNDIVSGKIEPLPKATRARVREIGSKDKTDPLFLQVVDIISDATDKLTRG